jgi:hypothetical protein
VKSKVREVNSEIKEIEYVFLCLMNVVVFEVEVEAFAAYGTFIACRLCGGDWQPQRMVGIG